MTEKARWPKRVYGVGTEPDPRFTLANERTFLAWIRSSLALVAAGVAIEEFQVGDNPVLRLWAAAVLILVGAALSILSFVRWMNTERAMRQDKPLPGLHIGAVIAICTAASACLIVFHFLL